MQRQGFAIGALLVWVALLSGCSSDSSQNLNDAKIKDNAFSVSLSLPDSINDPISSAEVVISGEKMDTIFYDLTVEKNRVYGTVKNIPLGISRHIEIKIYNKNDLMIYYGDAYTDVISDKPIDVTITMRSIKGSINVIGILSGENQGFEQDPNTLALYHFNESTANILLDATERYNGTLVSGSRCTGIFGNGLSFSPGQQASFAFNNIIPDGTLEGTVELYFSFDSSWDPSGSYAIFGNNGARSLLIYKGGNLIYLKNHSNIFKSVAGAATLMPNRWYHLAGTWGSKGMRIFLDGKCIGFNTDYSEYQSSPRGISENTFYIGMKTYDGMEGVGINSTISFNGKIDEIRISNIARY